MGVPWSLLLILRCLNIFSCLVCELFSIIWSISINLTLCAQFVQKLQTKSFTNEEKLQVMKSVAEEFSVPFDSKALEWKITCGTQNKHVSMHTLVNFFAFCKLYAFIFLNYSSNYLLIIYRVIQF